MKIGLKNIIIAPLALMTLSACVYGDGYNQYDQTYVDDQYCDPYNEYDAYYGCDLEYGFANFGYGGGWHQDFYYPGFGFFIFDNLGRRFRMNDYYLGYWGSKRQLYFQSRFSDRRYSGYRLRSFPWSERKGKRLVRSDRARASRRAENRDDRFENRQDRRQARRDRRNQSDGVNERQRSDRRDQRNERRQARRSDRSNSSDGARERGNRGGNAQAGQNTPPQRASPPQRARPPQNRQEQSRPPRARPPRTKQNRSKRPNRSSNRSRQPRRNFPKGD